MAAAISPEASMQEASPVQCVQIWQAANGFGFSPFAETDDRSAVVVGAGLEAIPQT